MSVRNAASRPPTALVGLVVAVLSACQPTTAPPPRHPNVPPPAPLATPQETADSLIFATRELCVPFVVDGVPIETLVRRPSVFEERNRVHGAVVTRYRLTRIGAPEVTFAGEDCYTRLWVERPERRAQVVSAFRQSLNLPGYTLRPGRFVELPGSIGTPDPDAHPGICVHGRSAAVISISAHPDNPMINVWVQAGGAWAGCSPPKIPDGGED